MKWNFFGVGNMASALALGVFKNLDLKDDELSFYTPSFVRAQKMADQLKGKAYKKIEEMPHADVVMIGVKPQQVEELSKNIKDILSENTLIISILAGVSIKSLKDLFRSEKIIRVMPNTPAKVNEGVMAVCYSRAVTREERARFENLFSRCGLVEVFESENEIDLVTPVMGCGPAYVFEIARIMENFLSEKGIKKSSARAMTIKTLLGSAALLDEEFNNDGDDPETLRDKVTSKKGATFEALEVLKKNDLEVIFYQALEAAYKRLSSLDVEKN